MNVISHVKSSPAKSNQAKNSKIMDHLGNVDKSQVAQNKSKDLDTTAYDTDKENDYSKFQEI